MEHPQESARKSLEIFIGEVVDGLVPLPYCHPIKLPCGLDGHGFDNFEALADGSLKKGDILPVKGGLTAEIINVRSNPPDENAIYAVKLYYLH